jgi:AdoMet-dependent heme synthase
LSLAAPLPPGWNLFKLTDSASVPLSMVLELTRRCHLHCAHCYLNETQEPNTELKLRSMKSMELSRAEWRGVFEQLAEAGCMYLILTGGEIFLRPDLFDIIADARALTFNVRLFTTAMHVGEAEARRCAELGVERVEISLYGGPETHAKVTLSGAAFERSIEGARRLLAAGVAVTLKAPLMTINSAEYGEVIRLAESIGARFKFDPTITPRNDGARDTLALRLSAERLDEIYSDPRLISAEDIENADAFDTTMESYLCSAGRNAGAMDPYGNVYPCLQWLVWRDLAGFTRTERHPLDARAEKRQRGVLRDGGLLQ